MEKKTVYKTVTKISEVKGAFEEGATVVHLNQDPEELAELMADVKNTEKGMKYKTIEE